MKKCYKRIIIFSMIFLLVTLNLTFSYKKAQASSILVGAAAVAGGLTVGGILVTALSVTCAVVGVELVIQNWDEISTECADFLDNTTGAAKSWWDNIYNSAVDTDGSGGRLNEVVGIVSSYFDYFIPSSGGGNEPDPPPELEINTDVMGAVSSFLIAKYGYNALVPGESTTPDPFPSAFRPPYDDLESVYNYYNLTGIVDMSQFNYKFALFSEIDRKVYVIGQNTPLTFIDYFARMDPLIHS